MKTHQANFINSLALVLMPIWAYFTFESTPGKDSLSLTAFIPLFFGFILLLCQNGIKKENKMIAHIAVLVTFIAFIGLFMPLKSAISDGRVLSIIRVVVMLLTGFIAMFSFVKSFIQARQKSK